MFNKLDNIKYITDDNYEKLMSLNIDSQFIDNKGKTRAINVQHNGIKFSVILKNPIMPLNIKIDDKLYSILDDKYLEEIVTNYLEMTTVKQIFLNEDSNNSSEIQGKFGNIDIILLYNKGVNTNLRFTKKVRGELSLTYNNNLGESQISLFKFNKKLSRYITEYFIWLYSIFVDEKIIENPRSNIENVDQKLLEEFLSKYIVVDERFSYKRLKNFFSFDNEDIFRNRKMVINSEEVLKRLLYILRLEITRNFPNILKYKDYTFLQHYYLDPEDFEYFPNQVVLHDKEKTLKWLKEKSDSIETNKYMLYETIEPSFVQPYFFKNKNIDDDRIFIAQNTNCFEKAI